MNSTEFKAIRKDLGLSAQRTADALGIQSGRAIRYYESGQRPISGPVERLMLIYNEYPLLIEDLKDE